MRERKSVCERERERESERETERERELYINVYLYKHIYTHMHTHINWIIVNVSTLPDVPHSYTPIPTS